MPQFRKRPTRLAQALRNNATDAERHLWQYLSRRQLDGAKFSRQMPVGPFIADFLCRERFLIVELDGGQHSDNRKDAARTTFLEETGYRVLRFWNHDVLGNTDGVLHSIAEALQATPPPTPSRKREGEARSGGRGMR